MSECVTCGDIAATAVVRALLDDDMAVVRPECGPEQEVSVALVDVRVGDAVLVHAGEAIAVVSRD